MSLRSHLRSRDLTVIAVCTVLADIAILAEVPLARILFGVLVVLFLPGYALVSALFRAVDSVEHVAYAIGSSVVLVSTAGLVVHVSPFAITDVAVLAVTNAVVVGSLAVAARRRGRRSGDDRVPTADDPTPTDGWRSLFTVETRTDRVLSVVLLGSLLLATGSVAYAVTAPDQGKSYTEFYLLTQDESGEFVANDYPTEFVSGEPQTLFVGVDNHEGQPTTYTLVVEIQRIERTDDSVTVLQRRQLDERQIQVGSGESKRIRHEPAPDMQGQGLRLAYLLYEGTPPQDPTVANAYQSVYLRVDVSASNATG